MLLEIEEKQIEPDITVIGLTGKLASGGESQRIESFVEGLAQSGRLRSIPNLTGVG